MNPTDHLRQQIETQTNRLRASIPTNQSGPLLAVLRLLDQSEIAPATPDLITGHALTNPGRNRAIQLCLEAIDDPTTTPNPDQSQATWAGDFIQACDQLVLAEVMLSNVESGFIRLDPEVQDTSTLNAWIASKRTPSTWREREDFSWWAAHERERYADVIRALTERRPPDPSLAWYRELAEQHVNAIAFQLGYPAEAVVNGCSIALCRRVVVALLARALQAHDRGEPAIPQAEFALLDDLATDLGETPEELEPIVSALTLTRENAAHHAAVPGIASAPLVRFGGDQIVVSRSALLAEPFLFLTREFRRQDAQAYHNSAYLREIAFRTDLQALFEDKRFVTSPNRIELRRSAGGTIRTDIDAAVFDRKTGTLAIFELKSQDPFARSLAELERRRDNVLYANRQVSGTLEWITRHGADEILNRLDSRTAKRFRAHKVFPFVLGRFLAQFHDGAAPDKRAVWASWPAVLRALDERPIGPKDANPVASLFARLSADSANARGVRDEVEPQRIVVDELEVRVYSSVGAYRTRGLGR